MTTLETHGGVVQQDLGSVRESELTVAQLLCIIIVVVVDDNHLDEFLKQRLEGSNLRGIEGGVRVSVRVRVRVRVKG